VESGADAQPVPVEKLFSAIGEFFVAFSGLIAILEHMTAALIANDGDEGAYRRARIAVAVTLQMARSSLRSTARSDAD